MSDTLRADANAAWERAWRIYPETNVEDGTARTIYIAGYLAGISEGRKIVEQKSRHEAATPIFSTSMKALVSQTEATKGNDTAQPVKQFKVGHGVIVDAKHFGEITEDMMGGFYRVEVDAYPQHQYWTVNASRMELTEEDTAALKGGFIETEVLSDGSKVYDVHLPDQILNCRDEKSALALIAELDAAIAKYTV